HGSSGRMRRHLLSLAIRLGFCGVALGGLFIVRALRRTESPEAPASQVSDAPPKPAAAPQAPPAAASASRPQLGINLSGLVDWNTELPFVDVFKLSRTWISQKNGQPWGSGPALALDPHGWVTRLDPGCYAETLLCTIDGGHYPAGTYTLLYEGEGEFEASGAAGVASREPGK